MVSRVSLKTTEGTGQVEDKRSVMPKTLSTEEEQYLKVMKKIRQRPDTGPLVDLLFTNTSTEIVSMEACQEAKRLRYAK